ncbi:hypothetical protein Tco_0780983, partial [Tanacetum coccineum]
SEHIPWDNITCVPISKCELSTLNSASNVVLEGNWLKMVSTESLHLIPGTDKKFDGSFVVPTQPTNSSQDNIRMISMDAHNTQQQLAPQSEDGHHTITLSNISNIQQFGSPYDHFI